MNIWKHSWAVVTSDREKARELMQRIENDHGASVYHRIDGACEMLLRFSDGYTTLLPRIGIGNAVIHIPADGMPHISVSGPNKTRFQIPIEHCPKCGRSLLKRRDSNEV